MKILIDSDALPSQIKDILIRAAERAKIPMKFIASKPINLPQTSFISSEVVSVGADSADHRIIELIESGDLVITADVPLADRVISKSGHAIDPRGWSYTPENIKTKLAMRDLSTHLRTIGEHTNGPSAFGEKDVRSFANKLNEFLTKHTKTLIPNLESPHKSGE